MTESEVARVDPIKEGIFPSGTPYDFSGQRAVECENCGSPMPHDYYVAILGMWGGFRLPFGKNSTTGKVGKRSNWSFCAICGEIDALDEAAQDEIRKAARRSQ